MRTISTLNIIKNLSLSKLLIKILLYLGGLFQSISHFMEIRVRIEAF